MAPKRTGRCARPWRATRPSADAPHAKYSSTRLKVSPRSTRRYARLRDRALIQVLRPSRGSPYGSELSRACPACGGHPCNCPESEEKLVEAAGIEPATESRNHWESLRIPRPTLWRSPPCGPGRAVSRDGASRQTEASQLHVGRRQAHAVVVLQGVNSQPLGVGQPQAVVDSLPMIVLFSRRPRHA